MRRVPSKDGGSGRLKAIQALAASLGGSIESAYWAAVAALSMTVGASGAMTITTAELFSAADVDELVGRHGTYRAPGA